ncbi:hypothetical protein Tco_1081342 [Tanacetum coccineum]|uniref:Uncharacterized protein n=1 Tax=Tanacetum coccineum TaxID=301880 RepID=A0ABQ5HZD0_9ASTR
MVKARKNKVDSLALKVKKEVSDKIASCSDSEDEKECIKENVLDVVIQITSLENVQSRQRTTTKEHLLEDLGVIATKMKREGRSTRHEKVLFMAKASMRVEVTKMPKATTTDVSLTKSYIPKVSKIPGISPTIAQFYKPIENRNIHEGRVVDQAYYKSNNIERLFTNIRFNCLFQINKPIVPRFILDFYSQVTVQTDDYGYLVISFMIQHEFITLTLAQFGQILKIPYNGQAVFTNEWDLASLEYSQETEGPYCTDLPTLDDIRRLLELERVVVDRTIKSQTVALNPNQILTKELSLDMKQWEELIRENVFGLGGHRDHLLACLAHMLYCVVAEKQYNIAYFFVKRVECTKATLTANLPYGMFLSRLYRYVMETYPHRDNGTYDIVERVMRPLALRQTRRPRSDHGKVCRSISFSSSHHQGTPSHQHDDDDDDVETSRASTPSLTTYLNSLHPLDYQNYHMPSSSEQTNETLFARQTTLLNQTQRMYEEMRGGFKSFRKFQVSSPSAPNAPSKTPSTKDTSSSSIDYTPKSPTLLSSPSTNGYLNSPLSPPPRVPPPPPTQAPNSMEITLSLSPITPLDVHHNSPSLSPPIIGHPIPWNLLKAHGDSCLCCVHLITQIMQFEITRIFMLKDELQYMFSYIEHMLSQPPNNHHPTTSIIFPKLNILYV